MARRAHRPRKRFGQNFLYDPAIARRIVDAADISADDTVVELGAGKGILTAHLADTGARVIALEIDRDLCAELRTEFGKHEQADRVEILNADFTKTSLTGLLAPRGFTGCVLMGNIPYNLTSDVLFSFLVDEVEMISGSTLMLQKEVGDRIVSPPGSRIYGITSVILQSLYAIRSLFRVSPGSFNPRPRVASVVLRFERLPKPMIGSDELRSFTTVVKTLFQQRRKTLQKIIRSVYAVSEQELSIIEQATGIDLRLRPEALPKEAFLALSRALAEVTSNR
jgi:16S rRNA (adenine1518-N6/adenine1519-N6)-dimethyltransferase